MDRDTQQVRKTRFVCISDTHCQTPRLPKGDVLIHAGDLTNQGSYSEMQKTVAWLEKADFEAKIVVAGEEAHLVPLPIWWVTHPDQGIMTLRSTAPSTLSMAPRGDGLIRRILMRFEDC